MRPLTNREMWAKYIGFDIPTQHRSSDNVTTKEPRYGYIDGGIILGKAVAITRREFEEISYDEWDYVKAMLVTIPNLVAEEDIDRQVTLIDSTIPVITSLV